MRSLVKCAYQAGGPGEAATSRGLTQETDAPMSDERSETRWTAFEGEYPVAHAEARFVAERIAKERGFTPTHYVKRERAYPFKRLETFTVSTGTWTSHV